MTSTPLIPYRATEGAIAPYGSSPQDPNDAGADKLDVRWLLAAFNRRRLLFLSTFALVVLLAAAFTFTRVPGYQGIATVTIDTHLLQWMPSQADASGHSSSPSADAGSVGTQIDIIQSRTLADRVVRTLDLDHNPEYAIDQTKIGLRGRMMASVYKLVGYTPQKRTLTPDQIHQLIVDDVLSRLDVSRDGLSYVISIGYTDHDPVLAAQVANTFAAKYLDASVQEKLAQAQQASGQLSGRLADLKAQAARDNDAVNQYKIAHGLMSVTGTTLTEQEIADATQQLAGAKAQLAEDQAALTTAQQQLSRGSNGGDVGAALNSPVVGALRGQRAVISAHLADLSSRYGPQHPEMLKTQGELADVDKQIRAEIDRTISNLEAKREASRQRVASLEGSLNQSTGTLATSNRAMADLSDLQQAATASETLYEDYLSRYKQVSTGVGTEQSDAMLVSPSKVPLQPATPRVLLYMAVGVVVGLTLGLAAIILAEALDTSFSTGADLERRIGAPYIGAIPLLNSVAPGTKLSPANYAVAKPLSVYAEAFRHLRVGLLYSTAGRMKVIAVTSALMNEGKTTAAVCLAQTSAIQGTRTVVVDCDLRRRTILRYLDETPKVGLLEVLSGKATLDQALVKLSSGAACLPLVPEGEIHDDILGSTQMDDLLAELSKRFDLVILDTAPLLILSDTRALASKCDAVMMIVRWRKTPEAAVRASLRLLKTAGANVAGLVLSKVDAHRQAPYGYEDGGYYVQTAKGYFR